MHTVPHRGTISTCRGVNGHKADMGSQVDISTCTDACTHSNQGVGPEVGLLEHTH